MRHKLFFFLLLALFFCGFSLTAHGKNCPCKKRGVLEIPQQAKVYVFPDQLSV